MKMNCPIFIRKHRLTFIGILLGAVAGFLYWKWIGCANGTCPITSNPYISTIWGMALGGLLLNSFQKKNKKTSNND
jgi:hypothetical protein